MSDAMARPAASESLTRAPTTTEIQIDTEERSGEVHFADHRFSEWPETTLVVIASWGGQNLPEFWWVQRRPGCPDGGHPAVSARGGGRHRQRASVGCSTKVVQRVFVLAETGAQATICRKPRLRFLLH